MSISVAAAVARLRLCYQGDVGWEQALMGEIQLACGEQGCSLAERLGLPSESPQEAMQTLAGQREQQWRERANDLFASQRDRELAKAAAAVFGQILAAVNG